MDSRVSVFHCFSVSKRFRVFQTVSCCFRVFQPVSACFRVFQLVSGCLISHLVLTLSFIVYPLSFRASFILYPFNGRLILTLSVQGLSLVPVSHRVPVCPSVPLCTSQEPDNVLQTLTAFPRLFNSPFSILNSPLLCPLSFIVYPFEVSRAAKSLLRFWIVPLCFRPVSVVFEVPGFVQLRGDFSGWLG